MRDDDPMAFIDKLVYGPGGPPAIVVLTGAGVSCESGLATFRDPDGIWAQVRIEDVATPDAFARDPARVHGFYNARRRQLTETAPIPNAAHRALAQLERDWPHSFSRLNATCYVLKSH